MLARSWTASSTYRMWQKLAPKPAGRGLFSLAMCLRVPYFRTVLPSVRELAPGRCVVSAPKWWGVSNHIGTFHAIAACNLAEIAMGMLAEASVPETHRWLPKGMTVQYVAKAETGLRAIAELERIPDLDLDLGGEGGELDVPIRVLDAADQPVVTGTITIWITRRK